MLVCCLVLGVFVLYSFSVIMITLLVCIEILRGVLPWVFSVDQNFLSSHMVYCH